MRRRLLLASCYPHHHSRHSRWSSVPHLPARTCLFFTMSSSSSHSSSSTSLLPTSTSVPFEECCSHFSTSSSSSSSSSTSSSSSSSAHQEGGGGGSSKRNRKREADRQKREQAAAVQPPIPDLLHETAGQPYFDTHTHLDQILPRFKREVPAGYGDFKAEYFKNGFDGCLTVSADVDSIEPVLQLIGSHDDIYGAFGIHPHVAKTYTDEVEKRLEETMSLPKTLAWGEIGLDYHYNLSTPEKQQEVFARQIKMAVKHNKPLVIHTREAEDDTLRIMRECLPKEWRVHVHCFTSSLNMAKALLDEWPNLYIGYTGVITFGGSDLHEVVRHVPLERFLLETDGPYMAPTPFRGKVCHPGHVPFTAKKVSELKSVPLPTILQAARENTRRMYGV